MTDKMAVALDVLEGANMCADHATDITPADIAEVIGAEMNRDGGWAESYGFAFVRLTNGQFAVFSEWEDTSGHG